MGRITRKMVSLILAATVGLGGLISPAPGTFTAYAAGTGAEDAARAESSAISDNLYRSLLAELSPDSLAAASGLEAPQLDPLPALTKEESIVVAGNAAEDAEVTVTYSVYNGAVIEEAAVTADATGRFYYLLELSYDGVYQITAVAERDGETSAASAPVIIEVDRTPPARIEDMDWQPANPPESAVWLQWEPPLIPDGNGGWVTDPTIVGYRIYDKTNQLLKETTDTESLVQNLNPASRYEFRILAFDAAGNEAPYNIIYAGTSPAGEVKLTGDFTGTPLLTRDGSAVLYVEAEQHKLHRIDTATGADEVVEVTADGQAPNGDVKELAADRSGRVVAFVSNATNLDVAASSDGSRYAVYVYHTDTSVLTLISDPEANAAQPSLPTAGDQVVFVENNQIYAYDLTARTKKLISHTDSDAPGNGVSKSPAISGDGSRIAYMTTSTDLQGASDPSSASNIAVYDRNLAAHIWISGHSKYSEGLSISDDGRFIAMSASEGSWRKVHAIDLRDDDPGNWFDDYFPDNRESRESQDKNYGAVSMSGDGRYVLAALYDNNPKGNIYLYNYIERFDRDTGQVDSVGNPALQAESAQIDGDGNRVLYIRDGEMFTYCYGECRQSQSGDTIDTASWSVPNGDLSSGHVHPGSAVTVMASGTPERQLLADVAYREMTGGDPAQTRVASRTIELIETPAASGIYRAAFPIADGMTQIESITVRLSGGSAVKAVAGMPLAVAGKLAIDIATEYPSVLDSAWFDLTGSHIGTMRKPLSAGVTHYEYWMPAADDLALALTAVNGTTLARKEGIVVNKGAVTAISLSPAAIASSLTVRVSNYGNPAAAQVLFTDSGGTEIARTPTDAQGAAVLAQRQAGERIRVAVVPAPEFRTPPEQTVTLAIGGTELSIPLERLNDVYRLEYAKVAGSAKLPVIDSDAVLTVRAAAGHTVRAKLGKQVWQADGAQAETEEWVPLAETPAMSGSYSGDFRIEEGTAALNGFRLEIDGALQPQVYPIQRQIAGRLSIVIDAPPDSEGAAWLNGASVNVAHSASPYEASSQKVDSQTRHYMFDVAYADSPYQVFLSANRSLGGPLNTTSPGYGQTAEVTIVPLFPFEFRINVQKDGESGGSYQATLRDTVSREMLWSGGFYNTGTAKAQLPRRAAAPEQLELTVVPEDPAYEAETISFSADEPIRSLNITLHKKPEAILRGRVLGTDGKPAAGSAVTAMIESGGFSKTYTAKTDASGSYSLRVAAGAVQLRGRNTSGSGSLTEAITVEASGEQTVDLQLKELATVTLLLYTRLGNGAWEGPIQLDSATATHLRVTPAFSYVKQEASAYKAWAAAGDTVSICVYGHEAGLPRDCQEAVVGANNKADIEIRLENAGGQAAFRAYQPDGSLSRSLYATLYDLNNQTIKEELLIFDPLEERFVIPLASGGSKRVFLRESYTNSAASIDFTAQPGGIVSLGDIRLRPAGFFNGGGNGLEAGTDWTTPGGQITLRAVYKNTNSVYMAAAKDAVLAIEWPAGVTYTPGTLVLNGKAVEPNVSGRTLEVPIGDIAGQSGGSLHMQLKVESVSTASQLAIVGKMKYNSGVPQEQIFGTAVLSVQPVTIRAPEIVVTPQFVVNGFAPAGSEVTVYDGGVAAGKTTASPAGTWTLPVTLAGTEEGKHRLTTEAAVDGARSSGAYAVVIYEPHDPGLESVSMQQQQGRLVTFDPASGVAVFPYVVVPGRPFVFDLKFRDVSRISDVYVQMGDQSAKAQLVGDRYQAILPFTYNLGPVSVDFRKKPQADAGPGELPTEEAYRNSLPAPIADYEVDWKAGPGETAPDGSVMPAGTVAVQTRINRDLSIKMKVTTEPAAYTPSASDERQAAATGVSVYGFSISKTITDNRMSMRISGYVPKGEEGLAKSNGGHGAVVTLGAKETLLLKTIEFTLDNTNLALTIRDLIQGTMDVADPDSFERRVNAAIAEAEQICDPAAREYYLNFAWEVKMDIFLHNMVKLQLGIAAVVAVPGGLFGLAFWGESYYIGLKLDEVANNELTELEDHLRNYRSELCKKKPKKDPVAEPKFIWDPSGYVYEGIPANRVEGATATVLEQDRDTGEWRVWDADWYGQTNPLKTDARGQYGWDVPEGRWKVKYEKDGYADAYSDELDVPPPQLEVNVPLVSYAAPRAVRAKAAPGGAYVDVYFDKPIDEASMDAGAFSVVSDSGDGAAIPGTVQAVNAVEANGKRLSSVIRFTPAEALADGGYEIAVSAAMASYAGVPVGSGEALRVQVSRTDDAAPAEAANVRVGVTFGHAAIMWTDPADDDYVMTRIRWRQAGAAAFGPPLEAAKDTEWAQMEGLPAATGYDFMVTTVDESGNESSGVTASWTAEADWQAPLPVTGLKTVSVTDNKIALAWTDPSSASDDLAKLRLSWAKTNQPDALRDAEAPLGAGAFTISGLTPATEYMITITAIDRSGNESPGLSIKVRTNAASSGETEGNGGNGNGGGDNGNGDGTVGGEPGSDDPNAAELKIGAEGGKQEAFGGWVALSAEPGAFPAATVLRLKRGAALDRPLAAGYTQMTETLDIAASDGAALGKPLQLSIRLDPAVIGKADARKLGLYRLDPAAASGWTYAGGVLERAANRLTAAIPSYGTYAVLLYDRSFADLTTHWSRDEVGVLISRHLADGVSADRFEPDRSITRAEVTKLLVSALEQGQSGAAGLAFIGREGKAESLGQSRGQTMPAFPDVPDGAWYAPYVRIAASLGLVYGDDVGFRPNDPVTREELAVLLQRFAGMQGFDSSSPADETAALERFADAGNVSDWARAAVAAAVRRHWIQGMTETELQPQGQASRSQAASLLLRLLTSLGAIER